MSRAGLRPAANHAPRSREVHRVDALHVHRAAAPDHAVPDLAAEGIDAPVLGEGRHHIEVSVHHERRPRAILALPQRREARAARL